jgi:hypothetical protein
LTIFNKQSENFLDEDDCIKSLCVAESFHVSGEPKRQKQGSSEVVFEHRFSKNLACKFIVDDSEKAKPIFGRVVWSGKMEQRFLKDYIKWMNSVMEQLSLRWSAKLVRIYQLSPSAKDWQFYGFKPGMKAERLSKFEYDNWINRN